MQPVHTAITPVPGMIDRLFGRKPPVPVAPIDSRIRQQRLRAIEGSTAADRAAEMLSARTALMQLSHDEARAVVAYMRPHRIAEGTTFIKEGDTENTDFMLLVLDGEVTIETIVVSRTAPITVT